MRSDSAVLRDVMCVTCHARQVHAFAPVDVSCKDAGCHENVKVRLGKMADQTSLHCTTCHNFTRPISPTRSVDSGRQELVPLKPQCFTCHEMREKLRGEGLDRDPHKATCGICHDPHTQEQAAGAIKSCATSECHANADTLTAFHRGLPNHALDKCTSCHKAHTWKVESTNCITCHKGIFKDRPPAAAIGARTDNPAPAVWNAAPHARRAGERPVGRDATADAVSAWQDDSEPFRVPGASRTVVPVPVPAEVQAPQQAGAPFPHARHRSVACTTCHSTQSTHGAVTVRDPAACQGCHHAQTQRAPCQACHASDKLAAAIPVEVTHPGERARHQSPAHPVVRACAPRGARVHHLSRRRREANAGQDVRELSRRPPHRRARLHRLSPDATRGTRA